MTLTQLHYQTPAPTVETKKYMVSPNPADAFGPWIGSGKYYNTIDEARKARTRIAKGAELPSRAVWIWNTQTKEKVE